MRVILISCCSCEYCISIIPFLSNNKYALVEGTIEYTQLQCDIKISYDEFDFIE